jgi:hypothetical protein
MSLWNEDINSLKLPVYLQSKFLEFFFLSEVDAKNCDYGVVVSSNHKERTCLVKWLKTVDIYKGEQ